MIEINGKVYRNLQEQVEKLTNDLEDTATKQYVDNSISAIYGDFYTKDQADDRFPTETHMNLLLGYKQDVLTTGNGIDITNNVISVDSTKVLITDSDDNLNKTLIRVNTIAARDGEDTDNKGSISFGAGTRSGNVFIDAGGEQASASIYVRGTTAVDSEGIIELNGQTTINTANRINVVNGSNTEQIAYLSDINTVLGDIETLLAAI